MAEKKVKKVRKVKPSVKAKDNTSKGVKVSVTKRNNATKEEECIKGEKLENSEGLKPEHFNLNANQTSVGMSKGYSFNMGNYESAKVSCWINLPCENTDADIQDTLDRISGLLDEQLEFEANELDSEE